MLSVQMNHSFLLFCDDDCSCLAYLATQKVSDEKNSAIWRFPADNDDSFAIKSNLHLCFLLFEATNDTLLGSAIFPGNY